MIYMATKQRISKLTCAIYLSRQTYFKTGELIGKFDLQKNLKLNPHFGALHSQVAQQAIAHVSELLKA
jgi:putative transposase